MQPWYYLTFVTNKSFKVRKFIINIYVHWFPASQRVTICFSPLKADRKPFCEGYFQQIYSKSLKLRIVLSEWNLDYGNTYYYSNEFVTEKKPFNV